MANVGKGISKLIDTGTDASKKLFDVTGDIDANAAVQLHRAGMVAMRGDNKALLDNAYFRALMEHTKGDEDALIDYLADVDFAVKAEPGTELVGPNGELSDEIAQLASEYRSALDNDFTPKQAWELLVMQGIGMELNRGGAAYAGLGSRISKTFLRPAKEIHEVKGQVRQFVEDYSRNVGNNDPLEVINAVIEEAADEGMSYQQLRKAIRQVNETSQRFPPEQRLPADYKPPTQQEYELIIMYQKMGVNTGGYMNRGTRTIPVKLTKGEIVLSPETARRNLAKLQKMNKIGLQARSMGGVAAYRAAGGMVRYANTGYYDDEWKAAIEAGEFNDIRGELEDALMDAEASPEIRQFVARLIADNGYQLAPTYMDMVNNILAETGHAQVTTLSNRDEQNLGVPAAYKGKERFVVRVGSPHDRQLTAHPAYDRTVDQLGRAVFTLNVQKARELGRDIQNQVADSADLSQVLGSRDVDFTEGDVDAQQAEQQAYRDEQAHKRRFVGGFGVPQTEFQAGGQEGSGPNPLIDIEEISHQGEDELILPSYTDEQGNLIESNTSKYRYAAGDEPHKVASREALEQDLKDGKIEVGARFITEDGYAGVAV